MRDRGHYPFACLLPDVYSRVRSGRSVANLQFWFVAGGCPDDQPPNETTGFNGVQFLLHLHIHLKYATKMERTDERDPLNA